MRFSDIPKFIHGGNYAVDMPLDMLKGWLDERHGDIDMDPDFQRGHVWSDAQASKYIEFLLRGGQSSRDIYWNHPAHIGRREKHSNLPNKLLLVDGKQRVTACLRFLNNEIPVFGHLIEHFTDKGDRRGALGMCGARLRMHVNNLQTRRELLQWYLDLNDGGVVHTSEELNRVRNLLEQEIAD